MQLVQCFLLGLAAAGLGTTASIRARLSNLININPSINIVNPANVTILDTLNGSTVSNASSAPDISTALDIATALNGSNPTRAPLNVLISQAYLSTIQLYHGAILLEAHATARSRPALTPAPLTDVRLIFSYGPSRTIYREMQQWGVWGPPRVLQKIPPQDDGALPFEIEMDIVEANILLRQAGFTDKYDAVDVRSPTDVPQQLRQVYYIFAMVGDGPSYVAVRVSDGWVNPSDTLSIGDGWLSGNASSTS
ncbi:hypothetical protein JMJ35_010106 [Cladonia borealis]|uniref:Uncharacterized protein n=1 Tax=Cladonia borealis TaxID=184061 RepID=A0AA39UXG8_9LECA|nr:hypothetical protein JMJ35_010106 [Cladonia borealis]